VTVPEIRRNPITGELVILAPERGLRPQASAPAQPAAPRPAHRPDCPFCVGSEERTPGETLRLPAEGPWQVRAFPNRFSTLSAAGENWRRDDDLYCAAAAVGPHEVIAESARHDLTLAAMEPSGVHEVVRAWHHRLTAFYADPRVVHVSLFKNHGPRAGASQEHAHSQVVGLPLVPEQQRRRTQLAFEYLEERGGCLFCRVLRDELVAEQRLVHQSAGFVSFIPWAALSPFHLWIFPRRHAGAFSAAQPEELADLAAHLHRVLRLVDAALDGADYNLVVHSGPPAQAAAAHRHWYLSVVPRVTASAGFELGTAMFVNPSLPENSAVRLREAGRTVAP
jgi:UDPglucose--hexose-1-phosphate uridylyltransferase